MRTLEEITKKAHMNHLPGGNNGHNDMIISYILQRVFFTNPEFP